jgi:hypothetical protein
LHRQVGRLLHRIVRSIRRFESFFDSKVVLGYNILAVLPWRLLRVPPLLALKNTVDIRRRAPKRFDPIRPIGDQARSA